MSKSSLLKALLAAISSVSLICLPASAFAQRGGGGHGGGGGGGSHGGGGFGGGGLWRRLPGGQFLRRRWRRGRRTFHVSRRFRPRERRFGARRWRSPELGFRPERLGFPWMGRKIGNRHRPCSDCRRPMAFVLRRTWRGGLGAGSE